MVRKLSMDDVLTLNPAERLALLEEIWNSLAAEPGSVPVPESHRRELDARLEAYRRDPRGGSNWGEVEARVVKRK